VAAVRRRVAIYHCLAALHRLDGDVHALAVARGLLFTASDSGRVRAWAAPGCFNRGYLDVSPRGHARHLPQRRPLAPVLRAD